MSNYTIDQAQRDIANLRYQLTALQNAGQLGSANIAGNLVVGGNASVAGVLTLTNPLAVAQGGTGSATASGALANLGAAPTASPTFTGTVSFPGSGTWDSTGAYRDTWHNLSIPSGWTDVTGNGQGFRYKKFIEPSLMIIQVNMQSPSTAPANATILATLPSGYIPSQTEQDFYLVSPTLQVSGQQQPHFYVDTSGNIRIYAFTNNSVVSQDFRGIMFVTL